MSEHTAEPVATKRLERSRDDRMLAGVCGGLARYFGIHPAFYRVGFVVLTLLGGSGILVYLAAVLVMPAEGNPDSIAAEALRHRRNRPWPLIALSLLAVAGAVLLSRATVNSDGDAFWVLLLLAGGVILWITRHPRQVAPDAETSVLAAEDSRRVRRLGRILAVIAATFVILTLVAAAVFAAVFHVHLRNGIGDRTYAAASVQDVRDQYKLGIGNMRVDLGDITLPAGETDVATRVDVGKLTVVVPPDVALEVRGDAQVGQLDVLGSIAEGRNVDKTLVQSGKRLLVLDAHVGVGKLSVVRAVR